MKGMTDKQQAKKGPLKVFYNSISELIPVNHDPLNGFSFGLSCLISVTLFIAIVCMVACRLFLCQESVGPIYISPVPSLSSSLGYVNW